MSVTSKHYQCDESANENNKQKNVKLSKDVKTIPVFHIFYSNKLEYKYTHLLKMI